MTVRTYKRIDLAESQLEAAIGVFVSGGDRYSVITLAGAADVILCRLVSNLGKDNFTEHFMQLEKEKGGSTGTLESYGREVNDTLCINDLKHMDDVEDGYIEIEAEECALAAISKALANYVIIAGRDKTFVQAFLGWMQLNLDPRKYNIYCDPNWEPTT